MYRLLAATTLAALLAGALAADDSKQRSDREAFENAVVEMDKDIAEAQRNFTRILEPFQDGKPGDPADVRAAYYRFTGAVQDAMDRTAALKTPDTEDCRGFLAAFRNYLQGVRDHVQPELKTVVVTVEEKQGKLDLLAKLEIIVNLKHCDETEQPLRERMLTAAREFDRVDKTIQ
jgi:hypothetical protein